MISVLDARARVGVISSCGKILLPVKRATGFTGSRKLLATGTQGNCNKDAPSLSISSRRIALKQAQLFGQSGTQPILATLLLWLSLADAISTLALERGFRYKARVLIRKRHDRIRGTIPNLLSAYYVL